ncbi:STM4011 family radical SAM protein [Anatilimnocola floriformis]|uniref:STM4011 family radical SAM protein n=1 Tax=Anatilimnocola floriformis TaxID=2948575 RepID=UPI0020C24B86|nr:STM4011 family radical SAM protein [Anatilimnocola floriformis]
MALKLQILYRGPLSSCNYECNYCPFAKRHESAAELKHDRQCLERFVDWVAAQTDCELSILFTPWGEGLTRRWYQQALVRISQFAHVRRVAIQTNLSCSLDWLGEANAQRLALWCTFHPTQISRREFLQQCQMVADRGVSFSAGVVGLQENFEEIEALRAELPSHAYLWVNAFKDLPDYYTDEQVARLEQVDPLFRLNLTNHPSLGAECVAGESSVSIDGDGNLRRCHFVSGVLGNIYGSDWQAALSRRACPNLSCDCYIGYVNLPRLQHDNLFGGRVLERIPRATHWQGIHDRQQAIEKVNAILQTSPPLSV